MKIFTFILLAASMMLAISCKYILLKTEGFKQPAIENHESLSKFLSVRGIDTSEILCFKDTGALYNFYRARIGMPDAQFFNKGKKFIDYRNSLTDCNGMVSVFIENIDSANLEIPVEGKSLDHYLNDFVIEKTGQKFILENYQYEVYMIVYWAKFLGKVNKRKVYDWQEHVKKANQNGKRIRMILVNADYQDFWGISKDQIPEVEVK